MLLCPLIEDDKVVLRCCVNWMIADYHLTLHRVWHVCVIACVWWLLHVSCCVQFRREEDADKAVADLNNRWFNGRPVNAELSPVTDFREACCRQYEMGWDLLRNIMAHLIAPLSPTWGRHAVISMRWGERIDFGELCYCPQRQTKRCVVVYSVLLFIYILWPFFFVPLSLFPIISNFSPSWVYVAKMQWNIFTLWTQEETDAVCGE